jgi:hypothetical protein
MTTSDQLNSNRPHCGHGTVKAFDRQRVGLPVAVPLQPRPRRKGIIVTLRRTFGLALLAGLVLALTPVLSRAGFVGPSAITIDGNFSDWTGNVVFQRDGAPDSQVTGTANDITNFWCAISTSTGNAPASLANPVQNVYYKLDTATFSGNNPKQAYWVQLNLGVAALGSADHALQVYVDTSGAGGGDPVVTIELYSYPTPYPGIGAFTTGGLIPKVSNRNVGSGSYGVYDANATGAWATNTAGTNGYSPCLAEFVGKFIGFGESS